MNRVLKNSVPVRATSYIMSHTRTWFEASVLFAVVRFLARHYETSVLRRVWARIMRTRSLTEVSAYGRWVAAGSRALARLYHRVMPVVRAGAVYRAGCAVGRTWLRIWNGSLPGRLLHGQLTFRRLVILAFTMYLPIDYILRNVVGVAILSAVWDELFFIAGAAYALLLAAKETDARAHGRVTPLDAAIFLFCAVALLLLGLNSPDLGIAIDGYRATVQYILWFYVLTRLLRDDGDFITLCAGLCIMAMPVALHGIYQYIVAAPIPDSWVSNTEMGVRTRAFSITGSPNILGSLLTLIAPVAAGFAYTLKKGWARLLAWGVVGTMCLTILVTFSRGAWIGIFVAVVVFALLADGRLLGLLAAAASGAMFLPAIANRILYLFTDDFATASAVGGRALRWEIGYRMLSENPVLGFGLGRFGGAVAMQNQILEITEDFEYFYMDNYYLKVAVEMGYTGLIAFLLLIGALLFFGLRAVYRLRRTSQNRTGTPQDRRTLRARRDRLYPLAVGLYAGMTGVLAHCLTENIFEVPYMTAMFWGMAAALMYVGYLRPRTVRADGK